METSKQEETRLRSIGGGVSAIAPATEGKKDKVTVTSDYFEFFMDQGGVPKRVMQKTFKPFKTGYWITRAILKLEQESRAYFQQKKNLVERHVARYEEDFKETDDKGKVVREFKKGDIMADGAAGVTSAPPA